MATIREIAERCGVSKPTVRNNLMRLGLWEEHVREEGGTLAVDEAATAAVCDAILQRKTPRESGKAPEAPASEPETELAAVREVYEARIADLQEQIRDLRLQLDGVRGELREAHMAAIDHARALPEAREAAREAGAKEERDRIRSMGMWARLTGRF